LVQVCGGELRGVCVELFLLQVDLVKEWGVEDTGIIKASFGRHTVVKVFGRRGCGGGTSSIGSMEIGFLLCAKDAEG
jgi:hypothetical protein